jgi:hypothetical protein
MTLSGDEAWHFIILPFYPCPCSYSPPAAATRTILIDQFLVIHALAWLVADEFDLFHLLLVINRLQEFVADRANLNHDF